MKNVGFWTWQKGCFLLVLFWGFNGFVFWGFWIFLGFLFFFWGFKGQVRWPKGPPHLALNHPHFYWFVFLFVFGFRFAFLVSFGGFVLFFFCVLLGGFVVFIKIRLFSPWRRGYFCSCFGVSLCFSLACLTSPFHSLSLSLCLSLSLVLFLLSSVRVLYLFSFLVFLFSCLACFFCFMQRTTSKYYM